MIGQTFDWMGRIIPFRAGESIAAALDAADVRTLGSDPVGNQARYFCGIGACQSCLVRVDGLIREACMTPARAGMQVKALETADG